MPKLRSVLSSWIFKIGWRGGDKPRSFGDSWCVGRSCGIDHNPVIRRAFGALRDATGGGRWNHGRLACLPNRRLNVCEGRADGACIRGASSDADLRSVCLLCALAVCFRYR
jgi:hypothetical protein